MTTITEAMVLVEDYMSINQPTFLWGPSGIGKSAVIAQMAAKKKWALNDFRAHLRESVELRGIPMIDAKAKKSTWLSPDDLPDEKRDGKQGILFLDELPLANSQVQGALFGLVYDRKIGNYTLPDGWQILAAGNRISDRSGAHRLHKALANRFAHIEVHPDAKAWIENYGNQNAHEYVVAFMYFKPGLLHDQTSDPEANTFPTPRTWAAVSKLCDRPLDRLFNLARGLIGDTVAAEFISYVEIYKSMPDIMEVIAKPKTTAVPTEPSLLYAMSTALSRFADKDNFKNVLTFAERMGKEYEIIVTMDSANRNKELLKTKAYVEFLERNQHLHIGSTRRAA